MPLTSGDLVKAIEQGFGITLLPINMCHLQVVTDLAQVENYVCGNAFPINRCHQQVVTSCGHSSTSESRRFQLIGVTNKW